MNKKLKEMQIKMDIKESSIIRISNTRWTCRYRNCNVVKDNFKVIIEVLKEEIDANRDADVAQAIGITQYFLQLIYSLNNIIY